MDKNRIFKFGVIGAAVLVALFFFSKIGDIVSNEYETVSAEMATVYDTVDVKAYILRDETVITNSHGGTVVTTAKNGEKVKASSTIAATFGSSKSAENYTRLSYLRDLLDGYKTIDSQQEYANVDVDSLGDAIDSEFDDILTAIYEGNYSDMSDMKLEYLVDVSRRRISFSEKVDVTQKIQELENEIASLETTCVPANKVIAGVEGYYVSDTDGFENTLPVTKLNGLTSKDIEKALKASPGKEPANCIGKVVGGFYWYLACVIDKEAMNDIIGNGKIYQVFINGSANTVRAQIHSVTKEDEDRYVLVLRCNAMNEECLALRTVNAKIVIDEYTGLKVPKSAVRVIDGNRCVYARVGNVTKQRYINVVFSSDEYVIAAENEEKTPKGYTHLRNHDEVIVNGKGDAV